MDGTCQPGELIQSSNTASQAAHLTYERW